MTDKEARARYDALRSQQPDLFRNSPEAKFEILFAPDLVQAAEAAEKERLAARGMPESWGDTGIVYEDPYMLVARDAVRRPDGSLGTYVRMIPASGSAGAAILPLIDNQIVLLRHSRHATRASHLEIPRGFGERNVSAPDQARRELQEEIGAQAEELIGLGPFHSNTGAASDRTELFAAVIKEFGEPQESEGITEIEVYAPLRVAELILSSDITDSFTIAAFTRAWLRGLLQGLPTPVSRTS
jgi:ADP-ribose pyrophosphatase